MYDPIRVCVHVPRMYLVQEDTGSLRTGVTSGCESLHGCWEANLGPLQEQQALLTAEPSFHSTNNNFKRQNYTFIFPRIRNARSLKTFAKLHPLTAETKVSLAALEENLSSDTRNQAAAYKCLWIQFHDIQSSQTPKTHGTQMYIQAHIHAHKIN